MWYGRQDRGNENVTKPQEKAWFRALARRPVSLNATVSHSVAGFRHEGHAVDLGLGGARLELTETLTVGDRVTLALTTPTLWDPVEIPARVAWQQREGEKVTVGVAFDSPTDETLLLLFDVLAALDFESAAP